MNLRKLSYSDLKNIKKDLQDRIEDIERKEYQYLGRDLEALQEYNRQTDKEKSQLREKLYRVQVELDRKFEAI